MRKTFMIVLALVVAMAGSAFADQDIANGLSVGSAAYVRGITKQYDPTGDADPSMYIDARGRFKFGYAASDYKAVLQLEIGDQNFTNAEDQMIVEVKHLYVTGPLGPATMTAGLQGLQLGNALFYGDDDWALAFGYNLGVGSLGLMYIKQNEGDVVAKDDDTIIGVTYAGEFGGVKLSPYLAYRMIGEDAGDYANFTVGVPVSGVFGPVAVNAEFIYQGGDAAKDVSLSAMALYAKAGMALGGANVYAAFGYGSGDDDLTDDEVKAFQPLAEDFTYDIVLEDDMAFEGKNGISNIMFIKVGADYAMGNLSVGGAVIIDRFNEVAEGEDEAIGTEIDVVAAYKLSPSMTLSANLGYLLPGDAWGDDAENMYRAYWKAEYKY